MTTLPLPGAASGLAPRVTIFDVPFVDLSYDESVATVRDMLMSGVAHHIVLANAHTLNLAYADSAYRARLQQASLVLRDGVGVKLAAAAAGRPLQHNFVGTDFVPDMLRDVSDFPLRVFLFGSKPGIAEAAARALARRCGPGLRIVGCQHGYLAKDASAALIDTINAAAPDVLIVALGNPAQEFWIADHLPHLHVKIAIGVGALLDFLADAVPRAPVVFRRCGLEWLFRLAIEPRRMWRRYLVGNVQFVSRILLASGEAARSQ